MNYSYKYLLDAAEENGMSVLCNTAPLLKIYDKPADGRPDKRLEQNASKYFGS